MIDLLRSWWWLMTPLVLGLSIAHLLGLINRGMNRDR